MISTMNDNERRDNAMTQHPLASRLRILLPLLLVPATILVVQFAPKNSSDAKNPSAAANVPTVAAPANASPDAPVPLSPLEGTVFVESSQTLTWLWPPGLAPNQAFAVRVGSEQDCPREIWTEDTSLDITEVIDSFEREVGSFYWQVVVINRDAKGDFESTASEWSPTQTLYRVRHISPTPVPPEQRSEAAQMVVDAVPLFATRTQPLAVTIDTARSWVSAHSDASTQDSFAPDYSDALAMMARSEHGESDRPRLLCDGQATALHTLLLELGIDSRLIFLYTDVADSIQEHTILEVFNWETQRWELHDVLSDRFFVDENGDRASIERVVFGPLESVSVCGPDHTCVPILDSDYPYRQHFAAFRYGYTNEFWVNPDRFNVNKRFPSNNNRNLAEYLTGNPNDFIFRFNSWEGQ